LLFKRLLIFGQDTKILVPVFNRVAANAQRAEQVLFQTLALTRTVGSIGSARLLSAVQQSS
jgi:hypothetical protein